MAKGQCRIFYVADIHGSERCFRKWLNAVEVYRPDVLVFGGDIAGKVLVPIVEIAPGRYACDQFGETVELESGSALDAYRRQVRAGGRYDVVLSAEEKRRYDDDPGLVERELFPRVVCDSVRAWMALADERLHGRQVPALMMLGNDDYPDLCEHLQGEHVANVEGEVVELPGGYEMISLGYSNRTPWDSPRELDEADLAARVEGMAAKLADPAWAVFNLHCPPKDSYIDQAALLDENFTPRTEGGQMVVAGVGSTAIRAAIERYQPLLGLHGHIHESPGVQKLGRTVVVNPGSDYADGVLRGAIVTLNRRKGVASWQLVQG